MDENGFVINLELAKAILKVYLQKKTVKYADYKIGKFYVSPYLFKDFRDPEQLFNY